jgi:hypothetical protein
VQLENDMRAEGTPLTLEEERQHGGGTQHARKQEQRVNRLKAQVEPLGKDPQVETFRAPFGLHPLRDRSRRVGGEHLLQGEPRDRRTEKEDCRAGQIQLQRRRKRRPAARQVFGRQITRPEEQTDGSKRLRFQMEDVVGPEAHRVAHGQLVTVNRPLTARVTILAEECRPAVRAFASHA